MPTPAGSRHPQASMLLDEDRVVLLHKVLHEAEIHLRLDIGEVNQHGDGVGPVLRVTEVGEERPHGVLVDRCNVRVLPSAASKSSFGC